MMNEAILDNGAFYHINSNNKRETAGDSAQEIPSLQSFFKGSNGK